MALSHGDSIDTLTEAIGSLNVTDIVGQPFKQRLAAFTRLAAARARLELTFELLQSSIEDVAAPPRPAALPPAPVTTALSQREPEIAVRCSTAVMPEPVASARPVQQRASPRTRQARPADHVLVAQRMKVLNVTLGVSPTAWVERVGPTTKHVYKLYRSDRIAREFDRMQHGDIITITAEAVDLDHDHTMRPAYYLREVVFGVATGVRDAARP